MVNSTCCPCRGSELGSQHPQSSSQLNATTYCSSRDLMPSSKMNTVRIIFCARKVAVMQGGLRQLMVYCIWHAENTQQF